MPKKPLWGVALAGSLFLACGSFGSETPANASGSSVDGGADAGGDAATPGTPAASGHVRRTGEPVRSTAGDDPSIKQAPALKVGAGDLIVVTANWALADSSTTVTISDSLGNSFRVAALAQNNDVSIQAGAPHCKSYAQIAYATSKGTSANDVITATASDTSALLGFVVFTYAGADPVEPIEAAGTQNTLGTTDKATMPALTTTSPQGVILASFTQTDGGCALQVGGAPFENRGSDPGTCWLVEEATALAPGTYTPSASTTSPSNCWAAAAVSIH